MITVSAQPLPLENKSHWLFGAVYYFGKDPLQFLVDKVPQYDGIFRVKSPFFLEQVAIVSKPDYVKHILQDNNKNYQKSYGYRIIRHLVGNGLLTSEGDFWLRQRRLAQTAFHKERLEGFVSTMADAANELITSWKKLPDGQEVNLSKEMMQVTLNIVCRCLFSADVHDVVDTVSREFNIANERLIRRIIKPVKLPLWMPTPGNLREQQSYTAIKQVVRQIVEKRRQSKEKYDDLLSMLMEAKDEETGEMMNNQQIEDEVITIFLAGHETTAVALTWLFHCLDENKEVEEKAFAEAQQVLAGRVPSLADLPKLDYTRMIIDETMRLYPPAWILGREALNDDEIGGYKIPKGLNVLIPVYQIQRDEQYWERPLDFIPERFTQEKLKNYHKFLYFPFGGGPRLCIGRNFAIMEMQVIVPMILQHFSLHKPADFKFKQDPLITMRPEPDMQVQVFKR